MMKINLANKSESADRTDFSSESIKNFLIAIVVALAVSYLFDGYKEENLNRLNQLIAKENKENLNLKNEIEKFNNYDLIKKSLDEEEGLIQSSLEVFKKIINDRHLVPQVLLTVSKFIPKDVWLTELSFSSTNFSLKGASLGFSQVSDFMKNLSEISFFNDIELHTTEKSNSSDRYEVATFELKSKKDKK